MRNVCKELKNNEVGKAKFPANKVATKPFLKDILRLTTLLRSTATLKLRRESKLTSHTFLSSSAPTLHEDEVGDYINFPTVLLNATDKVHAVPQSRRAKVPGE